MNASEYLEHLFALGIRQSDLPAVQPLFHKRIWERMKPGEGPDKLAQTIEALRREDHRFHMEGGSWTNNLSWVRGYENVLGPMEETSVLFHRKVSDSGVSTDDPRYRNALFHLLSSQTSCYRYWGRACGQTTAASFAGARPTSSTTISRRGAHRWPFPPPSWTRSYRRSSRVVITTPSRCSATRHGQGRRRARVHAARRPGHGRGR